VTGGTGRILVKTLIDMTIAAIKRSMGIIQNHAGDLGMVKRAGIPLFMARGTGGIKSGNSLSGRVTGVAG
jgi:hypothetical protein